MNKKKILTTPAKRRVALAAARQRERTATKIVAARYDADRDAVVVDLSTGATLGVHRLAIPGFARAKALADIAITPGSEGLWSEAADDGVLLEQLLVAAAGEATLGRIGGRINASKKSASRAAASRANGAKGGRPRKTA